MFKLFKRKPKTITIDIANLTLADLIEMRYEATGKFAGFVEVNTMKKQLAAMKLTLNN